LVFGGGQDFRPGLGGEFSAPVACVGMPPLAMKRLLAETAAN
jgi:hypothetical protein